MKLSLLLTVLLCSTALGGDTVTSYTVRFGNGTLTRRSDGSHISSVPFGNGRLYRESFRSGRTATHTTSRYGSGYLIRSSGSYVRKP